MLTDIDTIKVTSNQTTTPFKRPLRGNKDASVSNNQDTKKHAR